MSLEQECLDYLNHPQFQRFMDAWIDKYKRLGHLGGKIQLQHLSKEEQVALGCFLGMDLSLGSLTLSFSQFQKIWDSTKFEPLDFLDILKKVRHSTLYTNQQIRDFKTEKENHFKTSLCQLYQNTPAGSWLQDYLLYDRKVNQKIHASSDQYYQELSFVCDALNHLPIYQNEYMLLSVFSQMITKDPHYFDNDPSKELLFKGIEFLWGITYSQRTVEKNNEILYQAGLLKDDLSNNCYICHIQPLDHFSGWSGFYDRYEPWNMNLYNLTQVKSLFIKQNIYIVENPSVFRLLVDTMQHDHKNIGLICSNGQINFCTYMLLNQLVKSGCHLYYAGDYDPEGLLIADKLKQRYLEHLSLWCYDLKYFQKIAVYQDISEKRRQLLKHINSPQLQEIALAILQTSSVGYQEGLFDIYRTYLQNHE